MIDHLSFGVAQIERSRTFYDNTLGALGYKRLHTAADSLGYGADEPSLWLTHTARPVVAGPESGLHISFKAASPVEVDAFYRAALAHGGQDNGGPGKREQYGPGYYAAFVVDPDGYRIEAHCELDNIV
ncbi:VOC family protein [Burkholderia multivorans]|uniref:VOC family protein n=1 Tax=Burkholderia multivorans TaxID=87883 RepID=UPI00201A2170|nr:VOC family protein [Burkholderia multivorans]MCL4650145.1 VOC family protein [Burkholderia multivorans]MCL4657049.1 VOC family protein [Burkholderia multivorans]MCO1422979.1 VOC family protein [Burkholderia multivorans]UQN54523.1 VOC family protein [Burkholderia multivorans]UQN80550.1 VOC family protein [Burkholderia multivorans]